jgi:Cu/Ag efflux protein CusF
MLKAVKAGDKMKFDPDQVNGKLMLMTIERTRRGSG